MGFSGVERTWRVAHTLSGSANPRLHFTWHVLPEAPYAAADVDAWKHVQPLPLEQVAARTLDATAHLLRTCLVVPLSGLVAIADAAFVVQSGAVDWPRLAAVAEQTQLGPVVAQMLDQLRTVLAIVPPDGVEAAYGAHGVGQRAYGSGHLPTCGPALCTRFRRMAAAQGIRAGPMAAMDYSCTVLDVAHAWDIPPALGARLRRR